MRRSFTRRDFLGWLTALPLAGCSTGEIRQGINAANLVMAGNTAEAVSGYVPTSGMPVVDQLVKRQVESMVKEIGKNWTDKKVSGKKEYVKYTDQYQSRAIVNFDQGRIRVETRQAKKPDQALKKAIISTLLTPEDPTTVDLLSAREVGTDGQPFLYKLVVDHEGEFIRWQWRAERFADHLLQTAYRQEKVGGRQIHFVTIAMVREHQQQQQLKFQNLVLQNARRYNQPPALIYAIMEAESAFNPYAMSQVPAYGLMQIVPTTAGRDAHQLIYNREGTPSRDYLFIPENNIQMGTAYLHILDNRYLRMVEHPANREYCVISAYNTGSGNVLRAFHQDRNQAVTMINRMSPTNTYRHLVRNLPYQETRNYLPKVVGLRDKYRTALK